MIQKPGPSGIFEINPYTLYCQEVRYKSRSKIVCSTDAICIKHHQWQTLKKIS
ncbi:hypothetical protein HanRHA438_Chr09g0391581 [Helianthus annuus]|nr:hypothetical protein HanRHA438_Chr09g0391581 [Helianthus annuus]